MNLHSGLLEELPEDDGDLAHVVGAELVLVLDAEEQALGVVAHGHAEELVPLRAQVVVDHRRRDDARAVEEHGHVRVRHVLLLPHAALHVEQEVVSVGKVAAFLNLTVMNGSLA